MALLVRLVRETLIKKEHPQSRNLSRNSYLPTVYVDLLSISTTWVEDIISIRQNSNNNNNNNNNNNSEYFNRIKYPSVYKNTVVNGVL